MHIPNLKFILLPPNPYPQLQIRIPTSFEKELTYKNFPRNKKQLLKNISDSNYLQSRLQIPFSFNTPPPPHPTPSTAKECKPQITPYLGQIPALRDLLATTANNRNRPLPLAMRKCSDTSSFTPSFETRLFFVSVLTLPFLLISPHFTPFFVYLSHLNQSIRS